MSGQTCITCGEDTVFDDLMGRYTLDVLYDDKMEHIVIRGLPILKCIYCGEILFNNKTDAEINKAIRKHVGLLQPDEIREQLDKRGLSFAHIDAWLGLPAGRMEGILDDRFIASRKTDNSLRQLFAR